MTVREFMLHNSQHVVVYSRTEGPIAQWLEQSTHNRLVGGSSPSGPTSYLRCYTPIKDYLRTRYLAFCFGF